MVGLFVIGSLGLLIGRRDGWLVGVIAGWLVWLVDGSVFLFVCWLVGGLDLIWEVSH